MARTPSSAVEKAGATGDAPLAELELALSPDRFSRYVHWAGGDRSRALELYNLNVQLSEALYSHAPAFPAAGGLGRHDGPLPERLSLDRNHAREVIAAATEAG